MSRTPVLPGWLKPVNRIVVFLQRRGIVLGTMRVLSVPGRTTGRLRTTPVAPLEVDGRPYVIAGLETADWVRNARASGWGILATGRSRQRVRMVELPVGERAAILREFPRKVPHGVEFFVRIGVVAEATPEAFAAAAPQCPVFSLEPVRDASAAAVQGLPRSR